LTEEQAQIEIDRMDEGTKAMEGANPSIFNMGAARRLNPGEAGRQARRR